MCCVQYCRASPRRVGSSTIWAACRSGFPGRAQWSSTAPTPDSSTTAARTWAGVEPGQRRTATVCGVDSTLDSSGARSTTARTGTTADPPLDWILISPELEFAGYRTLDAVVSDHRAVVAEVTRRRVP